MKPEQRVETDPMRKGIIPQGLHRQLWQSHLAHQAQIVGQRHFIEPEMNKAVSLVMSLNSEKTSARTTLARLLHARLGHPGEVRLRKSRDGWLGVPSFKLPTNMACKCCEIAKASRSPHKPTHRETTYALELVHTDLMGPFEVDGIGGYKYTQVFVDEFTKRKFVYFLIQKSDARLLHYDDSFVT